MYVHVKVYLCPQVRFNIENDDTHPIFSSFFGTFATHENVTVAKLFNLRDMNSIFGVNIA